MPSLTRWYLRTACLWLVLACAVGAAVMLAQIGVLDRGAAVLQPVFYHLLMVGWATQLILGVAIWLFPVVSRERPRGDERLAWTAYGALNGGLIIRGLAEPLLVWQPTALVRWSLVGAAVLQVAAIWLMVLSLWPRIKGKAQPQRRGGRSGDATI